jgi:type II secretory pathway pseudopilin PulG
MEKLEGVGKSERREEGALIIELMIGTVVILVALSAIMSVVLSSAVMRRQNEEITLAYTAASNAMEELRTLPGSSLLLRNDVDFDCPSLTGSVEGLRAVKSDADGLPGKLTVTLDSSGGGASVYHVVAVVNWVGAKGQQQLSLESLIGARTTK